jgi:acyl-homoserine-lactone acylase
VSSTARNHEEEAVMRLRAATVMAAVAALVAIAAPPALASPPKPARAQPAQARLSAQIRYTTGGIPHILAHSWTSLGFGYGYAFAKLLASSMSW